MFVFAGIGRYCLLKDVCVLDNAEVNVSWTLLFRIPNSTLEKWPLTLLDLDKLGDTTLYFLTLAKQQHQAKIGWTSSVPRVGSSSPWRHMSPQRRRGHRSPRMSSIMTPFRDALTPKLYLSLVHSFVRSSVLPFVCLIVYVRWQTFVLLFIHSFIHSFTQSYIHSTKEANLNPSK